MKNRHIYTSLILLILTFSGLCGITTTAEAQDVHALLIILGNDRVIAESVAKNEEKMVNMLRQLSYHCNVHLTLMYSKSSHEGTVAEKTFINGRSEKPTTQEQDIIEAKQVAEWLENLRPKPEDTVLIYFTGHGKMDPLGAHNLLFNPGVSPEDNLDRGKFSDRLKQKSARLRMFITDTCSNYVSEDLSDDTFARYSVQVRAKARAYLQDLFLEHEGFLDITAASPGEFAIANDELGGHFTSALISQGFTATADTNNDTFLSWKEAFEKTKTQTKELYAEATFGTKMQEALKANKQKTQEPYQYLLPTRIGGGGGGSAPIQPPDKTASTAILNFTSVPSGAEVEIDGFVVGKTPLNGYELETDGRSTKDIEVTVKAEGYEDSVKKFRVPRGKPFPWNFELTKKAPEIPKTIRGQDGAEMVLIPAGEFQMGSNDGQSREYPVHTVYVDAFYMDVHEVTNAQYKKFVDANPQWRKDRIADRFHDGNYLDHWNGNDYPSGKANHPVVRVPWYAAMAYAKWAGKRLPTEAEWEKAARGGLEGQKYPWGNTTNTNRANYGNNVGGTTPVGRYAPNGYGLHNMAGNVWEWCLDEYDEDFYKGSSRRNPISGGSIQSITDNYTNDRYSRVLRGGSWGSFASDVRCARRNSFTPTFTNNYIGFRCARAVK